MYIVLSKADALAFKSAMEVLSHVPYSSLQLAAPAVLERKTDGPRETSYTVYAYAGNHILEQAIGSVAEPSSAEPFVSSAFSLIGV